MVNTYTAYIDDRERENDMDDGKIDLDGCIIIIWMDVKL